MGFFNFFRKKTKLNKDNEELKQIKNNEVNLVLCSTCGQGFSWNDSYRCQETPGSIQHNPPGKGNWRPRVFCPNCGYLIVEWHIDEDNDYNEWVWFGNNAEVNKGCSLPDSPLIFWGNEIPLQVLPFYEDYKLDVALIAKISSKKRQCEHTYIGDKDEAFSWQDMSANGLECFNSGNVEEAVKWIKKAADAGMPEADYAAALGSIGEEYFLLQKKDVESAQKYLEESVSVDFNTWFKAHYILSWIYEEKGDVDLANKKLRDGQRANPHKSINWDYEQKIRSIIKGSI